MTTATTTAAARRRRFGGLAVYELADTPALADAAARRVAERLADAVSRRGSANLVLATGPSQAAFVDALVPSVPDWSAVRLFHQDEYVGMSADHPASFRRWVRGRVLSRATPRSWHPLEGDASDGPAAEAARYTRLLESHRPDVCVVGFGENGHIAFNDPPADLDTVALTHVVTLEEACRRQQVGEGHFATLDQVPREAISLTVAGILAARAVVAVVPESRKALAVRCALQSPVSALCPATVLRTVGHAELFLDAASAALLDQDAGEPVDAAG